MAPPHRVFSVRVRALRIFLPGQENTCIPQIAVRIIQDVCGKSETLGFEFVTPDTVHIRTGTSQSFRPFAVSDIDRPPSISALSARKSQQ